MTDENVKLIPSIEALLFASPEPLSLAKITQLLKEEEASLNDIKEAIEILTRTYAESERAFEILEVGGGYRLMSKPQFKTVIARLNPPKKIKGLTDAAMETLAVIAYYQPLARSKIDAIRGVNCEGALRTLLDRTLVESAGRSEDIGRPLLYRTSQEFLKYFNLSSLDDLPREKDFPQTSRQASK